MYLYAIPNSSVAKANFFAPGILLIPFRISWEAGPNAPNEKAKATPCGCISPVSISKIKGSAPKMPWFIGSAAASVMTSAAP